MSKVSQFCLIITAISAFALSTSTTNAVEGIEMVDFSTHSESQNQDSKSQQEDSESQDQDSESQDEDIESQQEDSESQDEDIESQQEDNDSLLPEIVELIQSNSNTNIRYYKYDGELQNNINNLTNLIKQFAQDSIKNKKLNRKIESSLIQMLKNINELNNTDYTDPENVYQISYKMVGINDALDELLEEPLMFANKNIIEQISDMVSLVCNQYISVVFFNKCIDINENNRAEKITSKNDLFNMALTFRRSIIKLINNIPNQYYNGIYLEYYKYNLRDCVNNFYNGITDSKHFAVSIYGCQISLELNTLLQAKVISQNDFDQLCNQLSKICNGYASLSVFYGRININQYKH